MTTKEFIRQYNENYDTLVNYAKKFCHTQSDALDIVQDASIKAYKKRDTIESSDNFNGWMYVIIKNTFFNKYEKKTRRRKLFDKAPKHLFKMFNNTSSNKGVSRLKWANIMKRVSNVKNIYRKPFFMHYKGYSYEDIACHLDIPIGTVKSRIHSAKKLMRKELKNTVAA